MITTRTPEQNKRLNALMSMLYPRHLIQEMKESLALEHSNGRTSHTSALSESECGKLISELKLAQQKTSKELTPQMRKLFAIRHSLGWSYDRLSEFIKQQTKGEKHHTRQLTDKEVNTLVSVLEKIEANKHRR